MQRFLNSLAVLLALGLPTGQAIALGFGNTLGATTLGHPLNFAVVLRLDPDERLEASCVKAEVSVGDHPISSAAVRVRLEGSPGSSERRLRIGTTVPIDEPVVGIALHVGCPPRLARSFVVFADPPPAGAVAPVRALPDFGDAPEAVDSPLAGVVPPRSAATAPAAPMRPGPVEAPAKRAAVPRAGASQPAAAATTATASPKPAARTPRAPAVPARPRGPVLQLDPVEADALNSPSLRMSPQLSEVAAQAGAASSAYRFIDPELAQRLQDQERLKALEASIAQLKVDGRAREASIASLQARLQQAEAARYTNPLVYALAALCAVLAAGLGFLAWQRWRERRAAEWWVEPPAPAAETAPTPPPGPGPAEAPRHDPVLIDAPPPVRVKAPPPDFGDITLTPRAMAEARAQASRAATEVPPSDLDPESLEPHRPMSAEELIDLDQQVEFFVVLGQDDAAVDLLMSHVRSTGGVSPLPYLKLMEIYRRRGERDPYDRIRERFNRRFNAYATEWDAQDPAKERSLEDGYPELMARVQGLWSAPAEAMALLDGALFRRNQGPPFDVPAYRDLLFLYGIARDLAERDVRPEGVDLLLPMDNGKGVTLEAPSRAELSTLPLRAVREAPAEPELERMTLDLDISTDPDRLGEPAPRNAGPSRPGLDFDLSQLDELGVADAARSPKARRS